MPLKPGQKKDLKVKIAKLAGLEQLENKLNRQITTADRLVVDKSVVGPLVKEFQALAKKVQAQIAETKQEIAALKASAPKSDAALDNLIKTIAKECSQVLPYYRKAKEILLRGVDSNTDAFVGRSWDQRRTKDSSKKLQELYDMILKKNGFKALRSNSIFTTSDMHQAMEYGELYYIFPKNGFKYHWNKEIPDLVLDDPTQIFKESKIMDLMDAATEWYGKKTGKDIDFDLYEIMDDPQGFINDLKRIKYPKAATLKLEDFLDFKHIQKEIGPTQTNFSAGLVSGNEMMISGEYYAIKVDTEVANRVLDALKLEAINVDYF